MKYNSRIITAAITAVFMWASVASAQTTTYSVPVSDFNTLIVTDDIVLTVSYGTSYSLNFTIDQAYKNYIQVFNKEGQLSIGLDEKKVPSDVKKKFATKGVAAPEFLAHLTIPTPVSSITLEDKASLKDIDAKAVSADGFKLDLHNNATIASAALSSSVILVSMENRASATLDIKADNLLVNQTGNSELTINQAVSSSEYNQSGSSSLVVDGLASAMSVSVVGSSKSVLNGSVPKASYVISGSSSVNSINLSSMEADVQMNGLCTLSVAAEKTLKVDLNSGAKLTFAKSPLFTIVNVRLSSLVPYSAE